MLRGVVWGVFMHYVACLFFCVFCGVGGVVGFLILFCGLCVVVIKKDWKFLSTFIYNYLFSVVIMIFLCR